MATDEKSHSADISNFTRISPKKRFHRVAKAKSYSYHFSLSDS